MPATEIELDHGDKAFGRVIDSWDVQEHFGVAHEAVSVISDGYYQRDNHNARAGEWNRIVDLLCDPFKHAAWLEDESGKDDATQVGTGP